MKASLEKAMATAPRKSCSSCGKDAYAADLRLCDCADCGEEGRFWCVEDLKLHLKK
jgi:hypothetical protein